MPGNILQPLEIMTYDTDILNCSFPVNHHFELMLVEEGRGHRMVNDLQVPFKTGDLFIHIPAEKNTINLEEHSRIHCIKFQPILTGGAKAWNVLSFSSEQFRKLEFILYSEQQHRQSLIHSNSDKISMLALFNVLVAEASHRRSYADSNITLCLLALLNMVARNILEANYVQATHPQAITHDVLHYINYHIYEPEKLTVDHLAAEFQIAPDNFSAYFTKQYNTSLTQYILNYKIRLADTRLLHTRMSLAEIAAELHFDDADHFSETYTDIKGHLPDISGR
jgi:AraC-like DNA-binding protein